LPVLAASLTMLLLSFLAASTVYAQDTPYSEDIGQHDGGDRAEYLQEMEHSDSSFYVPPTN
jgi:hypothetical protein